MSLGFYVFPSLGLYVFGSLRFGVSKYLVLKIFGSLGRWVSVGL